MNIKQIKQTLSDIAAATDTEETRMKNILGNAAKAVEVLGTMPTFYADFVAEIQALGSNATYDDFKSELTLLIAEFTVRKTYADALLAAVQAVPKGF